MPFKLWTWTNALVYSPQLCFAPIEKFRGNLLLGLLMRAGVPATWCITLFSILKRNILILFPSLVMFLLHTGCLEALICCLLDGCVQPSHAIGREIHEQQSHYGRLYSGHHVILYNCISCSTWKCFLIVHFAFLKEEDVRLLPMLCSSWLEAVLLNHRD